MLVFFNSFFFLTVPPDRPIIYESKRREKAKNVEAYNEGSDVLLVCEVTGGKYCILNFKSFPWIKKSIVHSMLCPASCLPNGFQMHWAFCTYIDPFYYTIRQTFQTIIPHVTAGHCSRVEVGFGTSLKWQKPFENPINSLFSSNVCAQLIIRCICF